MPKISDTEKQMIQKKLFAEGKRLFTAYGIKKVTVDDLVQASGIAKGSFYSYYTNKEHLYMEIVGDLQAKIWGDMNDFLQTNCSLSPKELTKQLFLLMFAQLDKYPMLRLVNGETADYLFRKLPKEVIEAHTLDDKKELLKLQEYGIYFTCDIDLASRVLQTLVLAFLDLKEDDKSIREGIISIILNGVINEIVSDEK